jgi:hypothetical protein
MKRVLRNARGQTTEVDYGDGSSSTHHYNDSTDLRLNQLETLRSLRRTGRRERTEWGHRASGRGGSAEITKVSNAQRVAPRMHGGAHHAYQTDFSSADVARALRQRRPCLLRPYRLPATDERQLGQA